MHRRGGDQPPTKRKAAEPGIHRQGGNGACGHPHACRDGSVKDIASMVVEEKLGRRRVRSRQGSVRQRFSFRRSGIRRHRRHRVHGVSIIVGMLRAARRCRGRLWRRQRQGCRCSEGLILNRHRGRGTHDRQRCRHSGVCQGRLHR